MEAASLFSIVFVNHLKQHSTSINIKVRSPVWLVLASRPIKEEVGWQGRATQRQLQGRDNHQRVVPGRSACWDGQSHDLFGNGDSHPLCSLLLFLLQRKAGLLWSTFNLRPLSASSCKWLPTSHAHAGILPPVPIPPVLNATDHPAKPRGDNSFVSSSLCTGSGGSPALQPSRASLTGPRFSVLPTA